MRVYSLDNEKTLGVGFVLLRKDLKSMMLLGLVPSENKINTDLTQPRATIMRG